MIISRGLQLVTIFSAYLVVGASALAQEAPTDGHAYNTVEIGAVRYDCELAQGNGGLECDFLQTAIRRKKISQSSASDVKFDGDDCEEYPELLDILEGKRPPPKDNALGSITDVMKKDFISMFGAIVRVCRDPSEENKLTLIKTTQDQERRTCIVTANRWQESLKRYLTEFGLPMGCRRAYVELFSSTPWNGSGALASVYRSSA